jgi:hypothetical protein
MAFMGLPGRHLAAVLAAPAVSASLQRRCDQVAPGPEPHIRLWTRHTRLPADEPAAAAGRPSGVGLPLCGGVAIAFIGPQVG